MGKLKDAENKLKAYMISGALVKHEGNTRAAAGELGITPEALNWNRRRLGLNDAKVQEYGRPMQVAKSPQAAPDVRNTQSA